MTPGPDTPPRPSWGLLRALVGRAASSGALALLRVAKWAAPPAPTTRHRAVRSADLPCRCGHRQDRHRPVTEGGCRYQEPGYPLCDCPGFRLDLGLTAAEEERARAAHPSALPLGEEPPAIRGGIRYPGLPPEGYATINYVCPEHGAVGSSPCVRPHIIVNPYRGA